MTNTQGISPFNCQRCGKEVEPELHPCPFQEEICDNWEDICNCCEDCTTECAWDI